MKFVTALTRYPSSDFHKTKLVKCSCMKSLAKHEIRIKIKLPEDLDAYDRKKTRAWNDFDILFNVKYNFINSSEPPNVLWHATSDLLLFPYGKPIVEVSLTHSQGTHRFPFWPAKNILPVYAALAIKLAFSSILMNYYLTYYQKISIL